MNILRAPGMRPTETYFFLHRPEESTFFTFSAHAAYPRDRTRQENAFRACTAHADRIIRHLPKYGPPRGTTRPRTL